MHHAGRTALTVLSVLWFFGGGTASFGEKTTIEFSGRVVDAASGEPLVGATVFLVESRQGSATDREGRFTIASVKPGTYTAMFRLVGYEEQRIPLQLQEDVMQTVRLVATNIELPGVTVTEHLDRTGLAGSTHSVSMISSEDLDRHRGQTLGQTIEKIPGVTLLQTGPSISKPVIRGLHSQRVLVLNAGVPQEGQQWGGEHAPEIDPFAASSIEVLKGAEAVQYGSGAIGGVISVEPRKLRHEPAIDGEVILNGFTNNLQGACALMLEGGTDWLPGFGWRVQGSARRAGDARSADHVIGNSGFRELNASLAAGFAGEGRGLELYYSHFGTELGIYRGSHIGNLTDLMRAIQSGQPLGDYSFTYDIRPPKQEITHDLVSVRGYHVVGRLGRLNLQAGYQQNFRQEFDAHKAYNDSIAALGRPSFSLLLTTYTADATLDHQLGSSVFGKIGLSGIRQGNVRGGTVFLVPNFRSYSGGAYVLESWYTDRWTLTAGARYDYKWLRVYPIASRNILDRVHEYQNLSGAFGAIYQFSDEWSLGGNVGTAWRSPSVNELYSNDLHHGTAQFEIGNPDLRNEQSLSTDVTVRHMSQSTRVEISAYHNSMRHFIFLLPDPTPTLTIRGAFPTFRYTQANATLRGIDGMVEHELTPFYRIRFAGSLLRADNKDTGEPLFHMPADRVRLTHHFHPHAFGPLGDPYIELSNTFVRRQDRSPANVDYAPPPSGYTLFELAVGAEVLIGQQPIHLDVSVRNVFDVSYRDYLSRFRYYVDDPGRDISVRIRVPIGSIHE